MPDIFKYSDHRKFLKDAFKEIRKIDPGFSYRSLAKQLGLTNYSRVFLVVQGKRNLTFFLSLKLSNYLKLTRKQMYYFEYLTNFNQASTAFERDEYYKRMASLNPRLKKRK
jgi:uncharacterized protein (TIGR02147 family)